MTEQNVVSIEDVRVLVAERQRYDDWLTALEARRAETPARVFDRVFADYGARRAEVLTQLHTHVDGLTALRTQLDQRLEELEGTLAGLEDERAEAMLRTAVGEFDDTRWEEVRAQVEERITSLGQERDGLLSEVEEVRTLLASARVEFAEAPVLEVVDEPVMCGSVEEDLVDTGLNTDADHHQSATEVAAVRAAQSEPGSQAAAQASASAEQQSPLSLLSEADLRDHPGASVAGLDAALRVAVDIGPFGTPPVPAPVIAATPTPAALPVVAPGELRDEESLADVSALFNVPDALPSRSLPAAEINLVGEIPPRPPVPGVDALEVEHDDALALFSDSGAVADPGFVKSLDGIEVDGESGVGRGIGQGAPDVSAATVTPPSSPADPFDDLAFLRSVIDPEGAAPAAPPAPVSGARPASGTAQKTLRCTECGTMNLPTEWYCERCGGELAAF